MNKKVKKNLLAAIILLFLFTLGFLLDNIYAFIIATVADVLLILYVFYLANYQKKLDNQKSNKA
jgi:hypothetical protein